MAASIGSDALGARRTRRFALYVLVAATLGILTVAIIAGSIGASGLLVGMLLAMLPAPLYVGVALWLDRFEAEPPRLLFGAFIWGAGVAVFVAIVINTLVLLVVGRAEGAAAGEFASVNLSAPFVEELFKGIVIVMLYVWRKDEFDGIVDGVVYAGMVGLGFAMTENILYYGHAIANGVHGSLSLFVIRGVFSPFAHPLFTAMTGIGLGFARVSRARWARVVAPALGLASAICLHFLWNLAANAGGTTFLLVYVLVMIPTLFAVVVVVSLSLRTERDILRRFLEPDVGTALLSRDDLEVICTPSLRRRRRWAALRGEGLQGWRVRGEFYQEATELAFHRWRVERDAMSPSDATRHELHYHQRLMAIRKRLGPV